jgi:glycosyltransferase involved in cell wall biosynthesis
MTNSSKPQLLIFNDFFYPAFQAGGPIQSLLNLIIHLSNDYNIHVITSAYDLNAKQPIENVRPGEWSEILLPGTSSPLKVYYAERGQPTLASLRRIFREIQPDVIYINGMFTYRFVILPLLAIKNIKTVVSPRGMLQEGALAGKHLKKKIYLSLLRISGVVRNVWWHATNDVEKDDIRKIFGNQARVIVAGNIPKKPVNVLQFPEKMPGRLRFVYLSLITAKKNLLGAIESIIQYGDGVTLDIYGPVVDTSYWQRCEQAIRHSNGRINYKGTVIPEKVQDTFMQYDAGIFLTKAENFGHALYESLSAGRPILCSHFTPWLDLEKKSAGWNVDITNRNEIAETIAKIVEMDEKCFVNYCVGAHKIAKEYYGNGFDLSGYNSLF